uniref:(northern house mosquito) hypothetical protein n=1 Tax=Culex pipiens TaxID=7175 RepID=A0A8D8IQW6_CULPI
MTTLRSTTSLLRHVTSRAHTHVQVHTTTSTACAHSLTLPAGLGLDFSFFFFVVCKFHTLRPTVNVLSFGHTQEKKNLDFDRFSANFSRCVYQIDHQSYPEKLRASADG